MELMAARRRLMAQNPLKEYTATGNPATFMTNVAKGLKQLKIPFTPVQTGTGDPAPDNVRPITGWTGLKATRCGKNLFDATKITEGVYIICTTSSGQPPIGSEVDFWSWNASDYIRVKPSTYYTLTIPVKDGGALQGHAYYTDKSVESCVGGLSVYYYSSDGTGRPGYVTFQTPSNANYIRFSWKAAGESNDCQLEEGQTRTEIAPYSGTTIPISFPAQGKNLFDVTKYPFTEGKCVNATNGGTVSDESYACTIDFIPVENLAGETVTLNKRPGGLNVGVAFYSEAISPGYYISGEKNNNGTAGTPMTFTVPQTAKYMRFTVASGATDIQIEKGSQATTYEPYTNTVYGGELDLVTGVLTVTHKLIELDGVTDGKKSTQYSNGTANIALDNCSLFGRTSVGWASKEVLKETGFICNYFATGGTADTTGNYIKGYVTSSLNAQARFQFASSEEVTDLTSANAYFKTKYDNNSAVVFTYPLATPITYSLSPSKIISLIGTNTIWSDTNGTNTVKYLKRG